MLRYVSDRLTMTWDDYYELAKAYYEKHNNLEVPTNFKTSDGFTHDENGIINLGHWMSYQRGIFESLSDEKKFKLEQIGFISNKYDYQWQKMYELAKKYYEYHKNLNVPQKFKTINGYEPDEDDDAPQEMDQQEFENHRFRAQDQADEMLLRMNETKDNFQDLFFHAYIYNAMYLLGLAAYLRFRESDKEKDE